MQCIWETVFLLVLDAEILVWDKIKLSLLRVFFLQVLVIYCCPALDPVVQFPPSPQCSLCYCIRPCWRGIFFATPSETFLYDIYFAEMFQINVVCWTEFRQSQTFSSSSTEGWREHAFQSSCLPSSYFLYARRGDWRYALQCTITKLNFPRVLCTIGVYCQCYCILSSKDNIAGPSGRVV